jgi:hypothetical protein
MGSEAQVFANRRNAEKSTGPGVPGAEEPRVENKPNFERGEFALSAFKKESCGENGEPCP